MIKNKIFYKPKRNNSGGGGHSGLLRTTHHYILLPKWLQTETGVDRFTVPVQSSRTELQESGEGYGDLCLWSILEHRGVGILEIAGLMIERVWAKSWEEQRDNFFLQGQLSVLTLI